jgi:hypothetical protein
MRNRKIGIQSLISLKKNTKLIIRFYFKKFKMKYKNLLNRLLEINSTKILLKETKETTPTIEKLTFDIYSLSIVPIMAIIGILSNITFLIVLNYNKKNETYHGKYLKVKQPLRYLTIAITISDIVYLLNEINEWSLVKYRYNHYTSINGICQLYAYLINYFFVLNECHLITANFILLHFLYLKRNSVILQDFVCIYNSNLVKISNSTQNSSPSPTLTPPPPSIIIDDGKQQQQAIDSIQSPSNLQNLFKTNNFSYRRRNSVAELNLINYSNFVFYEKIVIIFYSFFIMYLLSFFVWIQTVKTYKLPTSTSSMILNYSMCETSKFARDFLNHFLIIFNLVRLLTLLFGFIIACFYIKKLNNFLINFLCNTFKMSLESYSSSSSSNFKQYLPCFIQCKFIDYNSIIQNNDSSDITKTEILVSNKDFSDKKLRNHNTNLKFVHFYSLSVIIYTLFVIVNVIFDLLNRIDAIKLQVNKNYMNDDVGHGYLASSHEHVTVSSQAFSIGNLFSLLDNLNKKESASIVKYEYYEPIAHFMEILAHSSKFYIYSLVSVHLRCFCSRKQNVFINV